MITPKNRVNNLFTGINSPHIPYPDYFSNFQEVGRLMGITVSKYPESLPNCYQEIAVKLAQKKQQCIAADNKFVVDYRTAMEKPLSHSEKNRNKTFLNGNTNQTKQSSLVNLTDEELDSLTESGNLTFVWQKGKKIYLNSLD